MDENQNNDEQTPTIFTPPAELTPTPTDNQHFQTIEQVPLASNYPDKLSLNTLLIIGVTLLAVALLSTLLSFATTSYSTASSLSSVVFYSSVLGSILTGASVAKIVYSHHGNSSGSNSLTKAGIILLVLSLIGGIFTIIPGLICLYLGSKKPVTSINNNSSKTGRIVLTIVAFLGAGFSSLAIGFVLMIIVSTRACELSSSKCY